VCAFVVGRDRRADRRGQVQSPGGVHPHCRTGVLATDLPRQCGRAEDLDRAPKSKHPGHEGRAERYQQLHVEAAVAQPLAPLAKVHTALGNVVCDVGPKSETDPPRLPLPRPQNSLHELRYRVRRTRRKLLSGQPRRPHPIEPEGGDGATLVIKADEVDGSAVYVQPVMLRKGQQDASLSSDRVSLRAGTIMLRMEAKTWAPR
jgi:hypothetical protein